MFKNKECLNCTISEHTDLYKESFQDILPGTPLAFRAQAPAKNPTTACVLTATKMMQYADNLHFKVLPMTKVYKGLGQAKLEMCLTGAAWCSPIQVKHYSHETASI